MIERVGLDDGAVSCGKQVGEVRLGFVAVDADDELRVDLENWCGGGGGGNDGHNNDSQTARE